MDTYTVSSDRPACRWLHRWLTVRRTPANEYLECTKCGARRAIHLPGAFMDPIDPRWVAGYSWSDGYGKAQ